MADVYFPSNVLGESGFTPTNDGGNGLNIGVIFKVSETGHSIRGIRWHSPDNTAGTTAYLYDNDGEIITSSGTWTVLGSGWHEAIFPEPIPLLANEGYVMGIVRTGPQAYSYKQNQFPTASGPYYIESNKGRWSYSDQPFLDDATSNASQSWYGIDAILTQSEPEPDPDPPASTTRFKGDTPIIARYRGGTPILKTMRGNTQVWPTYVPGPDPEPDPEPPPPGDNTAGWFLTTSNTGIAGAGVTSGMLTDHTGSNTITGTHYRKRFNMGGTQLVLGTGAELQECEVVSSRIGGQGAVFLNGSGQKILDTTIRSTASPTGTQETLGIHGNVDGFLMERSQVVNFTIPTWLDGSSGAATSYINDSLISCHVWTTGEAHRDGFTRRSGHARLEFHRSKIVTTGNFVTAAVFLQSWDKEVGSLGNMHWYDCMFEAASWVIAIEHANNITFDNNRFISTGYGVKSITQGAVVSTWTNNYHYANDPDNDYRGALIP